MSAAVFLGPTLPVELARRHLDAAYLPPAAQGDVWRVVTGMRPAAIGIVDGRFGEAPAVWHKEILFAMSQGVHVFGAASMGALRAAELAAFGMRGVGAVFEAYRDNRLAPTGDAPFEDDDEVAVLHGPAEAGWRPLSEAMVDVRCALATAEREGAIDAGSRARTVAAAKAIHFAERTWPLILERAGLPEAGCSRLMGWLARGAVSRKAADALLLLDELRRFLAAPQAPLAPSFAFAHTSAWAAAVAQAARAGAEPAEGPLAALGELRLDPDLWRATRRAALLEELVGAEGAACEAGDARPVLAELRERLGLADRRSLAAWALANDVPADFLERRAAIEAGLRRRERELAPFLLERMLDRLRLDGRYAALRRRAEAKRAQAAGGAAFEADRDAPEDVLVLRWYFEQRLGAAVPDDLDAFAAELGYADAEALRRALWREFRFVTAEEGSGGR